ncbi:MAG: hypothetical protein HYV07_17130 [Deltaproteobacteria bacterium]|nr:hypothetical protein [Deltaproteobacteria bacterium]
MADSVVVERHDTTSARIHGALFVGLPLLTGLLFVAFGSGLWRILGGGIGLFIGVRGLAPNLKFPDRLELVGDRIRVRRMWTRRFEELDPKQLEDASFRLDPDLRPATATLRFRGPGPGFLFLAPGFFPEAKMFLERLVHDLGTGLSFPARLGPSALVHFVRYLDEPGLGSSASYALPDGVVTTVYLYPGSDAPPVDGPSSPEAARQFDQARSDVHRLFEHQFPGMQLMEQPGPVPASGDLQFLATQFETPKEPSMRSFLFLTVVHGVYLKVRCTGPATLASLESQLGAVLRALATAVRAGFRDRAKLQKEPLK